MKKLATVFAAVASLAIAAPVFACPHEDAAEKSDNAPRTAEKDKKEAPKTDKAKEAAPAKEADKTKTAKPAEKKGEKVSSK
jgi:hypothetical protein